MPLVWNLFSYALLWPYVACIAESHCTVPIAVLSIDSTLPLPIPRLALVRCHLAASNSLCNKRLHKRAHMPTLLSLQYIQSRASLLVLARPQRRAVDSGKPGPAQASFTCNAQPSPSQLHNTNRALSHARPSPALRSISC